MNFVLVHGGWHTGDGWQFVSAELQKDAHRTLAPTLAGHGHNVEKRGITHAISTQSVVDACVDADMRDIVLVGHSYGGSVIQKVAEAIPERIRRLVFYNAFVLQDEQCLLDENPPHYVELVDELAAASGDDSFTLPFEICREAFFNSVDITLAQRLWQEYFSPQPAQPFRDKLELSKFFSLDIPRSYLNCTEDIALPPGEAYGWHPKFSSRLGLYRLVQMPGDHEALLTNPERLAQALVEAGRD